MSEFEYRIIWKRKGYKKKFRRYATLAGARRYSILLGPEPWKYYTGDNADNYVCCSGFECNCSGETYRQLSEVMKEKLPPIEFMLIERRKIGEWEDEQN